MAGWFRFERDFIDHPLFDNPKMVKVWVWCKSRASFIPQKAQVGRETVPLEVGQFLFGRKAAAEKLKIPETTLRDYMKMLESADFIAIKTTHSYSIITITYKPVDISFPPGFSPANGQQMDTYKNVKNDKNKSISPDIQPHPNQNRIGGKSAHKERYHFNPWVGSFSAAELTEDEKKFLPKIEAEHKKKLADYLKREGIENEYEVDPFKFPTSTEFQKTTLDDIRKGRLPDWLK